MILRKIAVLLALTAAVSGGARTFSHYVSTDSIRWHSAKAVKSSSRPAADVVMPAEEGTGVTFHRWGTTFNEQDWKALCMLTRAQQDEILRNTFAPDGELRFSLGRISMNANDYALDWYSCSDIPGDFSNRYFNIERDKLAILPYIMAAQHYNPDIKFWMSPWSPPVWMKVNNHYAVQSNPYNDMDPRMDHLLFGDSDRSDNEQVNPDKNLFPRRMAVRDYMIQDSAYLKCYADQFCRFIELYAEQGVDIGMVMYQNEAYSYTPYPGCPWTSDGILRFNIEYLAPALKMAHPEVELCLGTFNTNRYDHVSGLLSDARLRECISGIGFQWEGGQILPRIRKEHPEFRYISSESECGNGSMDWSAAEHTFGLINHYLGNGCSDYNNWNLILCDNGESRWGWRQNGLIRVSSSDRSYTYTPEYYAYRHYSSFIGEGTEIVGYSPASADGMPVLVARNPDGRCIVVAGNFTDAGRKASVKVGDDYLNVTLPPHSLNTFVEK